MSAPLPRDTPTEQVNQAACGTCAHTGFYQLNGRSAKVKLNKIGKCNCKYTLYLQVMGHI